MYIIVCSNFYNITNWIFSSFPCVVDKPFLLFKTYVCNESFNVENMNVLVQCLISQLCHQIFRNIMMWIIRRTAMKLAFHCLIFSINDRFSAVLKPNEFRSDWELWSFSAICIVNNVSICSLLNHSQPGAYWPLSGMINFHGSLIVNKLYGST